MFLNWGKILLQASIYRWKKKLQQRLRATYHQCYLWKRGTLSLTVRNYFNTNIPNWLTNLTLKASYIGFVDDGIPRWVLRKESVLPVENSASIKQYKTTHYKRNKGNIDMVKLIHLKQKNQLWHWSIYGKIEARINKSNPDLYWFLRNTYELTFMWFLPNIEITMWMFTFLRISSQTIWFLVV